MISNFIIKCAFLSVFAGILILFGCSSNGGLSPAPTAKKVAEKKNRVYEKESGVTLEAEAGLWQGNPEVAEKVTPLRIAIENNSGKALRFCVNEFELVSPTTGERFEALPLYVIKGTIEDPDVAKGYQPILAPAFYQYGFLIAPYLSSIYKEFSIYREGPYFYDVLYYNRYDSFWKEPDFPSQEMRERALPDGVVNNGGRIEGFIYFEKITAKTPLVNLNANLVEVKNEEPFGIITIPFLVKNNKK